MHLNFIDCENHHMFFNKIFILNISTVYIVVFSKRFTPPLKVQISLCSTELACDCWVVTKKIEMVWKEAVVV
jgi:hypothetical protein